MSEYTYNADNLRETKTVGNVTTEYVWDGQNLAAETKQGTTEAYTYDMTGVHTKKQGDEVTSYLKDYHGNVIGTADSTGRLDYDAYGNQLQGDAPDPFGYCGEYYDSETRLIYLRNRYYDPVTSRMLSEDTHWNTNNMIYGDNGNHGTPNIDAIMQSSNLYVYCMNDPINYTDSTGHRSKKGADKIIKNNAQNIKDAASEFGVNPAILAATIYAEQRLNVNWKDDFVDPLASDVLDVSLGVGQISISTAM